MKKVFLLLFLSSPSFAHQVLFNEPNFLKLADGDPIAAHELYTFCGAAGKNFEACKTLLSGEGKKKLLAARFCVQRFLGPKTGMIHDKGKNYEIDIPEEKFTFGKVWHGDMQKGDGKAHAHGYSEQNINFVIGGYNLRLIQETLLTNAQRKYVDHRYHFTDPRLDKEVMAKLEKEAEGGRALAFLENKPDALCYEKEKLCTTGGGDISKEKVIFSIPPIPMAHSTRAEECLKDELIRMEKGSIGVVRD